MERNLISAMFVVSLAGLCFTAATASGDVIFETGGTADPYTVGGYGDIYYIPSPSYNRDVAVAFEIPLANDYFLTTIEIGLGYKGGTNNIDVWLMEDNGGEPGTIIESLKTGELLLPDYYYDPPPGYTYTPDTMPLYLLTSSTQPILKAGTQYWVGASGVETSNGTEAFWLSTNTSFYYTSAYSLDKGSSWTISTGTGLPPALRVSGNIVPLPGAVWLLCTGLAASAGLLRRFRP